MVTVKPKPYPRAVKQLLAAKSAVLSKAHGLAELGMTETATPLWHAAATYEEQLAPHMEALGRDLEAAVHRISAASCHQRAGDYGKAVNLFRAALAGPLLDHTREDVQRMLADCLARLTPPPRRNGVPSSGRRG